MNPVPRRDFSDPIGHAGAAGDAMDDPPGALEHPFEHFFRAAHFPQHVDVNAALAIRHFVGDARLGQTAADGVIDQLFVAFPPGSAVIDHRHQITVFIKRVGIDAGKRGDAASRRPGARTGSVGYRDALAAFDKRQDFPTRKYDRIEGLQLEPFALVLIHAGSPCPARTPFVCHADIWPSGSKRPALFLPRPYRWLIPRVTRAGPA